MLTVFVLSIMVLICLGYVGALTLKQRFESETATVQAQFSPESTEADMNTAVAATATAKKFKPLRNLHSTN